MNYATLLDTFTNAARANPSADIDAIVRACPKSVDAFWAQCTRLGFADSDVFGNVQRCAAEARKRALRPSLALFARLVSDKARELFAEHGEVDSALLFESARIVEAADSLFPNWANHEGATPADVEGDQVAMNAAIEPAIANGIEAALIAEWDEIIERLSLPAIDAQEAAACLAVAASRGVDHLPSNMSDVENVEDALNEVECFIEKWEGAGI
jgi:hypothetical protein